MEAMVMDIVVLWNLVGCRTLEDSEDAHQIGSDFGS